MGYVSIFDEIEHIDLERFIDLRRELKKHDSFFALISDPAKLTSAEKNVFASTLRKYGVSDDALKRDDALENAAWAIMSRSTFLR